MNGLIGETALIALGLGNLGWLVLIAAGKLKTAGPARKGAATAPAPTARASGQPRAANGQFAAKPEPLRGVDAA